MGRLSTRTSSLGAGPVVEAQDLSNSQSSNSTLSGTPMPASSYSMGATSVSASPWDVESPEVADVVVENFKLNDMLMASVI